MAPGDEVLLPSLTFVATANAVTQAGAIPHLIDVEPGHSASTSRGCATHLRSIAVTKDGRTLNRSTGRRIAAIVPMHVFGQPVDHDALDAVAREFGLPVLVDDAPNRSARRGTVGPPAVSACCRS